VQEQKSQQSRNLELSYLSIGFSIRNGFLMIISTPEPSKQATLSAYLLQIWLPISKEIYDQEAALLKTCADERKDPWNPTAILI